MGDIDALRVMNTQKGIKGTQPLIARFKIVRPGDKRDQYAKMQGKTLRRFQEDQANGVFEGRALDFGGYYAPETYKDRDGNQKKGSVFMVLSIRPAKTREEIQALAETKRAREDLENNDAQVMDDEVPF